MDNCTVSGNSAASGGGVYQFGYRNAMATVTDCIVSGNTVSNAFGGGVGNIFGTLGLSNCTISDNQGGLGGGGISNTAGTATLTNCTVSENNAFHQGGGIFTFGHDHTYRLYYQQYVMYSFVSIMYFVQLHTTL